MKHNKHDNCRTCIWFITKDEIVTSKFWYVGWCRRFPNWKEVEKYHYCGEYKIESS